MPLKLDSGRVVFYEEGKDSRQTDECFFTMPGGAQILFKMEPGDRSSC
jgi:hypothetical protein